MHGEAIRRCVMPTAHLILSDLYEIAHRFRYFAVGWHLILAAAWIAVACGWRPSRGAAASLLVPLALSVALVSFLGGNPFNGAVFLVLSWIGISIAAQVGAEPIQLGTPWEVLAGAVMVAFGWCYPHFVQATSVLTYLYAAPMGLLPCPTLSIAVGLGLLAGGFQSRTWSVVVGVAGLFYGLVGMFRLGVGIDAFLTIGSVLLLAGAFRRSRVPRSVEAREDAPVASPAQPVRPPLAH
jgi:hypothetical protein